LRIHRLVVGCESGPKCQGKRVRRRSLGTVEFTTSHRARGDGSSFALLLGFSLVASLAAPAVSASEISVSNLVIRSITLDPKTKVATARGAVTCTGAESVEVFVDVSQTVGRLNTVFASGDKELNCDGRVRFSLKLRNFEGRLGPGDADVEAGAFACGDEGCFGDDFFRVMRVTKAG
jgi:hypothetical protein